MISVQHLTKQFEETVAVQDLSLEVGEGEIVGLIGPDGAGKTTTLRVISTAMTPTAGTVTVGGLDVVRQAEEVKKQIGYMPQRFALYPDLTVVENLNFFADVFGARPAERKAQIDRLLGFARLDEFRSRRAQNLSGGMQKKLALAATLMHRPRVLLLDEPTTGVDPVSRREFWDLVTEIHLEGVTMLIATPYLDEAERCTHVSLMYRGRQVVFDVPGHLRETLAAVVLEGQTGQSLAARQAVQALPGVFFISAHGDLVRALVDDAARAGDLQAAWAGQGITVQQLHRVPPRLEDAFVLLIK